jgi:hypothetical protein
MACFAPTLSTSMLKRALTGALKGVFVGFVVALALVYGLGIVTFDPAHAAAGGFGAALAYASSVVTGVLTGLVTGRPLWAREAKVEALIKAVVGALLGALAIFALRRWLTLSVDLGSFGSGTASDLPLLALPAVAAVLGLLFDIDNDSVEPPRAVKTKPARVAGSAELEPAADDDDVTELAAQRKRR